jgi:hypothetical protein
VVAVYQRMPAVSTPTATRSAAVLTAGHLPSLEPRHKRKSGALRLHWPTPIRHYMNGHDQAFPHALDTMKRSLLRLEKRSFAAGTVSQNGQLLSRRGPSLPANASGVDTHRDSISSRFDCRSRGAATAGKSPAC